jgi:hypothetical protein
MAVVIRRTELKFLANMIRAAKRRDPEEDRNLAEEALAFDNESLSYAESSSNKHSDKRLSKHLSNKPL